MLKKNRKVVKSWPEFLKPFKAWPKPWLVVATGQDFYGDEQESIQRIVKERARMMGSAVLPGEDFNFEDHALNSSHTSHLRWAREAHKEWLESLRKHGKDVPPWSTAPLDIFWSTIRSRGDGGVYLDTSSPCLHMAWSGATSSAAA